MELPEMWLHSFAKEAESIERDANTLLDSVAGRKPQAEILQLTSALIGRLRGHHANALFAIPEKLRGKSRGL